LGIVDRFYAWWLDGYDYSPEVKARILYERKHPRKVVKAKKGWRQRFHDWWMSGYPDYEEKPTESRVLILERRADALDRSEEPLEQAVLMSETPSKEDLDKLKYALGIEKGSMQYKKRGDGVYLAVYNSEKKGYDWKHLRTWEDLKSRIA
jgi:hypothetical protein